MFSSDKTNQCYLQREKEQEKVESYCSIERQTRASVDHF